MDFVVSFIDCECILIISLADISYVGVLTWLCSVLTWLCYVSWKETICHNVSWKQALNFNQM